MEGAGLSPRPEIEAEAERGEEHRADAAVEKAAVREAQRDRLKRSALERSPARGAAAVKMLRAADCSMEEEVEEGSEHSGPVGHTP